MKKPMEFTPDEIEQYLQNSNKCPHADCRGDNLNAYAPQFDDDNIYREVLCADCGRSFTEILKLVTIEPVIDPEGE